MLRLLRALPYGQVLSIFKGGEVTPSNAAKLSTSCRIFQVFQGAVLIRYKDTCGRDGWPWLPGNSDGGRKAQPLVCRAVPTVRAAYSTAPYKAIQK